LQLLQLLRALLGVVITKKARQDGASR
jgi:hypothetical protein